jgi:MtN3 and saliva related transmembrane protein
MDFVAISGMIGGFLTTISFLPQVVKVWKTRSTKDISLVMFILFTLGVVFWLFYGIFMNALPIILANGVTLILACIIITFKLLYK